MRLLLNLSAGLVFGLGLLVSGMADPAKVLNFLDVAGTWDPSLAFVMAGAVLVASIGFSLVTRRQKPVLEQQFQLPKTFPIDTRLLSGSASFGLGWGLSGLCPGPGLVSLPLAAPGTLAFVPALLIGVVAAAYLRSRQ